MRYILANYGLAKRPSRALESQTLRKQDGLPTIFGRDKPLARRETSASLRVAVCEPDDLFRVRVMATLREAGYMIAFAYATWEQSLARLRRARQLPLALIADADLVGADECAECARLGVLVLRTATTFRPEHLLSPREAAGAARGYVLRTLTVVSELPRILPLLSLCYVYDPSYHLALWARMEEAHEEPPNLSPSEARVLLLQSEGEGLTQAQIATRMNVSVGSVKSYTSRARGKIGAANRVEAAFYAREHRSWLQQRARGRRSV